MTYEENKKTFITKSDTGTVTSRIVSEKDKFMADILDKPTKTAKKTNLARMYGKTELKSPKMTINEDKYVSGGCRYPTTAVAKPPVSKHDPNRAFRRKKRRGGWAHQPIELKRKNGKGFLVPSHYVQMYRELVNNGNSTEYIIIMIKKYMREESTAKHYAFTNPNKSTNDEVPANEVKGKPSNEEIEDDMKALANKNPSESKVWNPKTQELEDGPALIWNPKTQEWEDEPELENGD